MIKMRLVKLLNHTKKYIGYQVLWQWFSLLCQVVMIYSMTHLIEEAFYRNLTRGMVLRGGFILLIAVVARFVAIGWRRMPPIRPVWM